MKPTKVLRAGRALALGAAVITVGASSAVASPHYTVALPATPNIPGTQQADAKDPASVFAHIRNAPSLGAVAARAALQRAAVTAAGGTWTPLGKTPLNASVPGYDQGIGYHDLSGRIQSFTFDPATRRVWAGVGAGGVWETDDMGGNWHSVSDNLSDQGVGALAWSTAQGGTLIDGSGDSGYDIAGQGIFRTLDDGRTWLHATGVPEGNLTYRVAVSPVDPSTIYAATSKGLYVSHDDAASFTNVGLPTGCTDLADSNCYFANWVTDVVVRPGDASGSGGGKVLAAVGWYDGPTPTAAGVPLAPGNGLYESDSGKPGTFTHLDLSGTVFTPQTHIGMTRLGVAYGAQQNHDIVYAAVQDVAKVHGGLPVIDLPTAPPAGGIPWPTALDGVYQSTDFGATWIKRTDAAMLALPTSQTSLGGASATYQPGIQAWYNLLVQPDPSTQDSTGAPTRVMLGLEELFESSDASLPGPLQFHTIGRYWAGTACFGGVSLPSSVPYCPTTQDTTDQSTIHSDQHGLLFVPDRTGGGETLFAGSDGGAFAQHVASGADFSNDAWGNGNNRGLHTLYPYMAQVAKDGTVVAGLQDNGEDKITPDGQQIMVYGGDGFFTAIDPNNSRTIYEEYTFGKMSVTTDGGQTWNGIDPGLTSSQFGTPFAMDPANANHLVTAGRNIMETTAGPNTTAPGAVCVGQTTTPVVGQTCATAPVNANPQSTDWTTVYDLGTNDTPGAAGSGVDLTTNAVAIQGNAVYVGWCPKNCDVPRSDPYAFTSGIATNVGGSAKPASLSSSGWHIAKGAGLPSRVVNWIAIDPSNDRTIYVALGGNSVSGQEVRHPGHAGQALTGGHVYRSSDAGATFTNISGDLPDTSANGIAVRGHQLIVGTDVGAFISSDLAGSSWATLGGGQLPIASVMSVEMTPGDANSLVAAVYGRGMWKFQFAAGVPAAVTAAAPQGAVHAAGAVGALPNTGGIPAAGWPTLSLLLALAAPILALVGSRRRRVQPLRVRVVRRRR